MIEYLRSIFLGQNSKEINYRNKLSMTFSNEMMAAVKIISIHTNTSEKQIIQDAITLGVSALEEIVCDQASYYRKEKGSNEILKLVRLKDK